MLNESKLQQRLSQVIAADGWGMSSKAKLRCWDACSEAASAAQRMARCSRAELQACADFGGMKSKWHGTVH